MCSVRVRSLRCGPLLACLYAGMGRQPACADNRPHSMQLETGHPPACQCPGSRKEGSNVDMLCNGGIHVVMMSPQDCSLPQQGPHLSP